MESSQGYGPKRASGRSRRRISIWTILAPLAVIFLWIAFFSALGNSCLFKECKDKGSKSAASEKDADKANTLPAIARARVKAGDTLGSIAAKYDLTQEELTACNPNVDAVTLQPGTFLFVSGERCEGADLAATGANPDPLAGDTAAGGAGASGTDVGSSTPNGTAAADPSTKVAPDPAATAAESGDEG